MSGAGASGGFSAVPAQSLFIAGTDTGVGKTYVAVRLIQALVARGLRVAAMKPVAAGAERTPEGLRNDDALALAAAANVRAPYALVNPVCLERATSPHLAAREAGVAIDLAAIHDAYQRLAARADVVIVEGAGGWRAPIDGSRTMAQVAQALDLPVVLVVGIRLGCLSHALLTAEAIRADGLTLAGWVANRIDPAFADAAVYPGELATRLPSPLLGTV